MMRFARYRDIALFDYIARLDYELSSNDLEHMYLSCGHFDHLPTVPCHAQA